jgi:two-component system, OmpR family, phosphate regulon sensor histidine kinase PhoR
MEGRKVKEVVRNTEFNRFVQRTLQGEGPTEAEIVFLGEPDRFLQAHGATLREAGGMRVAALVVLNDITRLKVLETVRRDFVANVSHELRTPITSIKGFLETLRDGAVEDPETRRRFLDIAVKNADRLNMIIDDLLSLARVERDAEMGDIRLETTPLSGVFAAAARVCAENAAGKGIELLFNCEEGATAKINPQLIEQALVNLVDNAIKYGEPGSIVRVDADTTGDEVVLTVTDQGCGISREHLNRIFERFYRVDKARSRTEGGTGLGLSIVKHIAHAHRGSVRVRSSPGEGSAFSIHLPRERERIRP